MTDTTPFLRIAHYDKVNFSLPATLTLQTWQIQSAGVGAVQLQVWYIAGGKASLRDQMVLYWDSPHDPKQVPTVWRLTLAEQKPPRENLLPTVSLQTVFDTGGPNSSASGLTDSSARATIRLPSRFSSYFKTTHTVAPAVRADRPILLFAAEAQKISTGGLRPSPPNGVPPPGTDAIRLVARDEKNPVAALTRRTETPGGAFLVLTLQWSSSASGKITPPPKAGN